MFSVARVPRRRELTHRIKATECGGARSGHGLSRTWADVDCPGALTAGPAVGAALALSREVSLWGEAEIVGFVHRMDGRNRVAPAAAAWVGLSFGR